LFSKIAAKQSALMFENPASLACGPTEQMPNAKYAVFMGTKYSCNPEAIVIRVVQAYASAIIGYDVFQQDAHALEDILGRARRQRNFIALQKRPMTKCYIPPHVDATPL
jgi:hypothetical protein